MRLEAEAADARARSDGQAEFIAKNRREMALSTASDLRELRTHPERYELPWPSRERLRLALISALGEVEGSAG